MLLPRACFEQAQQASPNCENLFFLGLARYRLKQPDEALIAFRSAVECNPKLLPAHLALAEAYAERHNDSEALAAYERVLRLDPRNTIALSGAANIYLKSKANQKAVELFEMLVAVAPKDADAHADLAAAYGASGDRQRAEEQFRIALKLRPVYASALMGLGNLCLKNGEEDRAIELVAEGRAGRSECVRAAIPAGVGLQSPGPLPGCPRRIADRRSSWR